MSRQAKIISTLTYFAPFSIFCSRKIPLDLILDSTNMHCNVNDANISRMDRILLEKSVATAPGHDKGPRLVNISETLTI